MGTGEGAERGESCRVVRMQVQAADRQVAGGLGAGQRKGSASMLDCSGAAWFGSVGGIRMLIETVLLAGPHQRLDGSRSAC